MSASVFNEGTITIDMFGNAFYRDFKYKMVTHARVFSLSPINFNLNSNTGVFFSASLGFLKNLYDYDHMCSWSKIKSKSIELPLTPAGDIDFEFTNNFIAELEAERLAELEAYLKASGLDDYKLTEEEMWLLNSYNNWNWSETALKDLFNIQPTKYIKGLRRSDVKLKSEQNLTPVISNTVSNNGVIGYFNAHSNNGRNVLTCSDTTNGTETMFYQKENFIGFQHIQCLKPRFDGFNEDIAQFIISSSHAAVKTGQYNYGAKFNRDRMNGTKISLPFKNGSLDTTNMKKLITAVKKLVIKDVIDYTDTKISTTKGIIQKQK